MFTSRYNLDPFDSYSDEEIWAALEKTYMKGSVRHMQPVCSVQPDDIPGTCVKHELSCAVRSLGWRGGCRHR